MESAERMKHLEAIQTVIARLANTSVLLKGWGVTLVTGLIGLGAAKDGNVSLILVALVPLFAFAWLDAYYLWLERRFRGHYERVRLHPDQYAFDMKTDDVRVEVSSDVLFRPAVWVFWGGLLAGDLIALCAVWR